MNTFLTILILFFIVIAIWQIVKIYDLTQVNITTDDSEIANDKDNRINGNLMLGFLVFIYVITIVCFIKYHNRSSFIFTVGTKFLTRYDS